MRKPTKRKKKISRKRLILLFLLWSVSLSNPTVDFVRVPVVKESTIDGKKMVLKQTGTDLEAFLRDVSWIESGENHTIISKFKMLGKYQFYWPTAKHHLKKWALDTITKQEFLSRPHLQDSVMISNLALNQEILKDVITKYCDQTINGVRVTRSGILAAAQFGPGKVIEFFEGGSKHGLYDGNGVHVGTYMQLFANYKLPKRFEI